MKTTSTYNCQELTKNNLRNYAKGTKLLFLFLLFVCGLQFTVKAQEGLPAANITGPLVVCADDPSPQPLAVTVYSASSIDSVKFSFSGLTPGVTPSFDAAELNAIITSSNPWSFDGFAIYTLAAEYPLHFFGGNVTGAFVINVMVKNVEGWNTASKSVTIVDQDMDVTSTPILCFGGNSTITALGTHHGVVYTYTYNIIPPILPANGNGIFVVPAGTYTLTAQRNKNGNIDSVFTMACIGDTTITITEPPLNPIVLNCPESESETACDFADQDELDAEFADWLASFNYTGGTNPVLTITPTDATAPLLCIGGTTTVTWTVADTCGNLETCTETFTVTPPTEVEATEPDDYSASACTFANQAEVDAAFATFISEFGVSGGCNPTGSVDELLTAPLLCTGGTVTVTYTWSDLCENGQEDATFTIIPPTEVEATEPDDYSASACTFANQAEVDAAFATFISEFGVSGGCNPTGSVDELLTAPLLCTGGTVTVTYTWSDLCENGQEDATFTIIPPTEVEATEPDDYSASACTFANQAEVDAAFATFISEFGVSGGCNPTGSVDELLTAPLLCTGGTVTVTYNWSDLCENGQEDATFTIIPPTEVEATEPDDYSASACTFANQAEVDAAFATFLSEFGVSGGCNPTGSVDELLTAPLLCTGGTVTVTYNWNDLCENGQEDATFTIIPPTEVEATEPDDYSASACTFANQAEVDAAFATFISEFGVSGGCNPTGSVDELLTAPLLCTGGTVTVTYTWSDLCENGQEDATFTIIPPTEVEATEPDDYSASACTFANQAEVDAAFATFISEFGVSGGCNPTGSVDELLTAPLLCTGGTVTVTYNWSDLCENGQEDATFTIIPPTEVEATEPDDYSASACTFANQAEVDAAFATFISEFGVSGGCNPTGSVDELLTAPLLCTGGTVTVTYTWSDLCENGQEDATFTIIPPTEVEATEPDDYSASACTFANQAEVDAAFATFISEFGVSGGCNPTGSVDELLTAPLLCTGGTVTVTYTWSDLCENGQEDATFTIIPPTEVEATEPDDYSASACTFANQAEVDAAFATFISEFGVSGGCNPTGSVDELLTAPLLCTGGTVTVTYNWSDLCENGQEDATFTIIPPTEVEATEPDDYSASACTFANQAEVDAAFATFISEFGVSGGCNPTGSVDELLTAPLLCTGGTVTVTYTWSDLCENGQEDATFTIIPPTEVEATEPDDYSNNACTLETQAAVDAAFATFLSEFDVSGGCNPTGSFVGTPTAPLLCTGGTVTVLYNWSDLCENGQEEATFTIIAPPPVVFNCGHDVTVPPCSSQAVVDAAWLNFLASTTASGGCNGNLTNNAPANPPDKCGGSVDVTWTYTVSTCNGNTKCTGHTCTRTFTVTAPPPVVFNCGHNVTLPPCSSQSDVNIAWANFLASTTASGGCNGNLTNNAPANPPSKCGGSVDVTWTYTSSCDIATKCTGHSCTKTFTVTPAPPVVFICGNDVTIPPCTNQATINAAYAAFKVSVIATGGCNGHLTNNAPSCPPPMCGGSINVTWTYTSSCNTPRTCTKTFTVTPPSPIVFNCGNNVTLPACSDQATVNAAWANFLASTTASGGCNGVLTNNAPANPPSICGGHVHVTWIYTASSCDGNTKCTGQTCTRTFTISPPPPVVFNCGNNVTIPACPSQSALNAAYAAFIASTTASGGCNGVLTNNAPTNPPDICGGYVYVTWTYTSLCDNNDKCTGHTCTKKFTVLPSSPVVFNCGHNVTVPACSNQATVNAAWTNFLASTTASGGCNGNLTNNAPANPPSKCGGSVNVTWTYTSSCDNALKCTGNTCTKTFTVLSAPPVVFNCGSDVTVSACSNQATINAAYAAFKTSVTASGGCNGLLTNNAPSCPPPISGGSVNVTWTYNSACGTPRTCTKSFTVIPTSEIVFDCGDNVTLPACSNQATINAAWTNFLASTTASGGCNGVLTNNAPANPPSSCGGHVHVTWTYTSLDDNLQKCNGHTCTRTFTVTAPPALVIHKPNDFCASSCNFANQAAVNAAFASWLTGFTKSGGCNPTASYGTPCAPNLCSGGTTTVTYTYSDLCSNGCVKAKFTIIKTGWISDPTTPTDPWSPTVDPMNIDLTISPNPFSSQTDINYTLSEDSKVSVEIYNIMGEKIATIFEGQAFADKLNTVKYVSSEHTGNQVLLCVIRTSKGIKEKRMVLNR